MTGQRQAQRQPHSTPLVTPVRLALLPLPASRRYSVVSYWEMRLPGLPVQRTSLAKTIELQATPEPSGALRVRYDATHPTFQQPDLTSYERVLVLLGRLYHHLELRVLPTGQIASLLNETGIKQEWAAVQEALVLRSGGRDEFTKVLVQGVEQQLARPGAMVASLRLDYLFGFLWQNVYDQRFESQFRYEQQRCFPRFFAGTDLWFRERLELQPAIGGQVAFQLSGPLDASCTDVPAVHRQIITERENAGLPSTPPAQLANLRGEYTAVCHLDQSTGWPLTLEASVRCHADGVYSKEYFLRLEQLPPL